jgi:hypothetical protein
MPVPIIHSPDYDKFLRQEELHKRFWRLICYQMEADIEIALPPSLPLWPLVPTEERTTDQYGDLSLTVRLPKRDPDGPLYTDVYRVPVIYLTLRDGSLISALYVIVADEFGEIQDEWRIPCETILHLLEQDKAKQELLDRFWSDFRCGFL